MWIDVLYTIDCAEDSIDSHSVTRIDTPKQYVCKLEA
jgi:hypothetical protein